MSAEATTIARPYAEAAFERAMESGKLDLWSDMLSFLVSVVTEPLMAGLVARPKLDRDDMTSLMLDIGGGRLSDEGQNLVRMLVANGRLALVPEIARLFEQRKAEHEGAIDVVIESAYAVKPAEEQALAEALRRKLGREVRVTSAENPDLIGGVRIRAGDLVIDGTVQARLKQLAYELGI
jgi:F-type H+-transporting ATPase subunit delta